MRLSARARISLRTGVMFIAIGTAVGAIFGVAGASSLDFYVCLRCLLKGALIGLVITAPIVLFELAYLQAGWGARLLRRPFLVLATTRQVVYLAAIMVGLSLDRILTGQLESGFSDRSANDFATAFMMSLALSIVMQVNRLLGPGVLRKFMFGRYHRPREEERVFLFLDLASSTSIAETVGNKRFHELLDRIGYDIVNPILEHAGEIYRYVGDQVIVTWPASKGLKDGASLRCCFSVLETMNGLRDDYVRRFGVAPTFHAAVHIGQVVSGEMGDVPREIVYLGDTVNTTSRIEETCREIGEPVLVSSEFLARIQLPDDLIAKSLGDVRLRGKAHAMELFSVGFRADVRQAAE